MLAQDNEYSRTHSATNILTDFKKQLLDSSFNSYLKKEDRTISLIVR